MRFSQIAFSVFREKLLFNLLANFVLRLMFKIKLAVFHFQIIFDYHFVITIANCYKLRVRGALGNLDLPYVTLKYLIRNLIRFIVALLLLVICVNYTDQMVNEYSIMGLGVLAKFYNSQSYLKSHKEGTM